MSSKVSAAIESLIKRRIFATEEEAIRQLLREYILRQIVDLRRQITRFERKYGVSFERFEDYLHERSVLLKTGSLSPEQRRVLGQAIMQEEDDWMDWKVAEDMLEDWLGLQQEVAA